FFFSSRRRHTRSYGDWSSDVCSSDLEIERSLAALDLTEAKYHVSQLKILDPTKPLYRAVALKIDLVRDVLSRPALYQTAAGIHRSEERRVGKGWRPGSASEAEREERE